MGTEKQFIIFPYFVYMIDLIDEIILVLYACEENDLISSICSRLNHRNLMSIACREYGSKHHGFESGVQKLDIGRKI